MDKIEFSKNISAYLENELDDEKKKEFELLVQKDPDCQRMLNEVEQLIGSIKETPTIETSRNFIVNLNKRIDEHDNQNKTIMERLTSVFSVSSLNVGSSGSSLKIGLSMSLLVAFSVSYLYFSSESISGGIVEIGSDPKTTSGEDVYISDSDSLYDEYEDDIRLTNGTE